MKRYRTEEQRVEILDAIVCDRCKVEVSVDDEELQAQEFLHIEEVYGYGSRYFGDMTEMKIDLCEKCTFELVGKFCRVENVLGWPDLEVGAEKVKGGVFFPMEDPEDLDIYQR